MTFLYVLSHDRLTLPSCNAGNYRSAYVKFMEVHMIIVDTPHGAAVPELDLLRKGLIQFTDATTAARLFRKHGGRT
jgi:hypothetical protein